jgi:predicted ATP-grasp superfamily ATP-dependent carboligase
MRNDSTVVTTQAENRPRSAGILPRGAESERKFGKVLLLDGYSTRTLACVRSWGRKGVPFAVGGETRWDMSLFSRYTKEKFVYTSPKHNLSKFIQDVNHYCSEFAADRVFPTSEAAIMACSAHRNELASVPIIPRERDIQIAFSKANTLKIAQSIGIATPKTVHITDKSLQAIDGITLKFPVVIKSESSEVLLLTRAKTSEKTSYVFSRAELESECKSRLAKGQAVLLQEFVDGYGVGVSGLFAEGRPVALLGHRRIRESNPLGGPSAIAESIEIEPRLMEATTRLFEAVGFSGPAMAEYKIDRRSGQPYLMEINARFWGTVLLAPAAGLDLPYLYWKMLNGMEIQPEEKCYQIGIKGRYLVGDTKWLLLCLRGKPRQWPGEFPKRRSAIRSFIDSFFDKRTAELIITRDDPMPFAGRLLQEFT